METDLVSMTIRLTGWYDTGRTNVSLSVRKSHFDSEKPKGEALTQLESLREWQAEVFMSEYAEGTLRVELLKAFEEYVLAMALPL